MIAHPEYEDILIECHGQLLEILLLVGHIHILTSIPSGTEDHTTLGIVLLEGCIEFIGKERLTHSINLEMRLEMKVVNGDVEPLHTLLLKPTILGKQSLEILLAGSIERAGRKEHRIHSEAEDYILLLALLDNLCPTSLEVIGQRLPPAVIAIKLLELFYIVLGKERRVAGSKEVQVILLESRNLLEAHLGSPAVALHALYYKSLRFRRTTAKHQGCRQQRTNKG